MRLSISINRNRTGDRGQRAGQRDRPVLGAGIEARNGTLRPGAVEAGMSKKMLSVPGLASALAAVIAARNEPAPLSDVLSTTKVESSRRCSSDSHKSGRRRRA